MKRKGLEAAKELIKCGVSDALRYELEKDYPDLKESEDERIRKAIIEFVKYKAQESLKDKWIAWLERQGEQKPADKVEPKFKVKYAGSEYNVLEVKDIAGVTYYGIEDEPNHIDYVQAENCERVGGYSIKENGSPYPTKPAVFSEQKPAWSEEDEEHVNSLLERLEGLCRKEFAMTGFAINEDEDWLKSLKDRILPQPKQEWSEEDERIYQSIMDDTVQENQLDSKQIDWLKSLRDRHTWKPSDEQMEALKSSTYCQDKQMSKVLFGLYQDLKKLKGE